MARVKAAVILLIGIIVYSAASLFLLSAQNEKLKGAIEEVKSAYERGDVQRALELSKELETLWDSYEKKVTMLIYDDALSGINISIAKLTPYIETENPEFFSETQALIGQIDQLYKEEFPSWYNIL